MAIQILLNVISKPAIIFSLISSLNTEKSRLLKKIYQAALHIFHSLISWDGTNTRWQRVLLG